MTKIGESAFSGCRSLKSIEIPDGVTIIGENAFADCESLNSIMIPANTTAECWGKVFSSCSNLFTIVVSKNNAEYKFINNSMLSKDGKGLLLCISAIIPDGVTMIAKSAFEGCNLTEIEIPEEVTDIGDEAFYLCYELRSIKIPDSVKAIGYAAFQDCEHLQSIEIHDGLIVIEDNVFEDCALQSVTIKTLEKDPNLSYKNIQFIL